MGLRKRIICYELKFDTLSCVCHIAKVRTSDYMNHLFTTKRQNFFGQRLFDLKQYYQGKRNEIC